MSPSVTIEHLSKRYRIGAHRPEYATLRDRISGMFKRTATPRAEHVWALRDVNLEIETGEAIGLIGHNGAGKSTLLKILTRITEPTEGRAVLRGRVASLLEVGTGFHPELTGRENIFLNGAILGMARAEIRQNFDDIVAFSEIGQFLDTPVKRYSSGMYVRLAFAVAAHLTPEILLVDEVLAVGDIEFQRRCLGRMNEVARSGRTVVFVSHNLTSIESLCSRAVLLRSGTVADSGPARQVVSRYLAERTGSGSIDLRAIADRDGSGRARITALELLDASTDTVLDAVPVGRSFRVRVRFEVTERMQNVVIGLALLTPRDERVFITSTADTNVSVPELPLGDGAWDCVILNPNLTSGQYHFEAWISDPSNRKDGFADHLRLVGILEIVPHENLGPNVASAVAGDRGRVHLESAWKQV